MGCGRISGGVVCVDLLVVRYVRFGEVESSMALISLLARFRRSVHLHRRGGTEQSVFGGYEWTRSIVGIYRACGWACSGEFDVFAVD